MTTQHDSHAFRPSRRDFLIASGALTAGASLGLPSAAYGAVEQLAVKGGPKAVTVDQSDAAHWPRYGADEEKAILDLIHAPSYDPNAKFEAEWAEFLGAPYTKAHFNGTSALCSMFFALNLPPGSEILVPSYTFFATIVPMRLFGLVPVFVDINPRTLNFDLEDAKKRLTPNTKAVLPVHWIGLPADMDHISEWANEKGLIVLEDAAHAQGARLKGKRMGTWGRMAIFSFQMSKPLPAIEGGMGIYQNQEDFDRATAFGNYDMTGVSSDSPYMKYKGSGLGLKLRMHPFAAALARCQLKGLDERNDAGVAQVRKLNDRLLQLPGLYEQSSNRDDVQRLHYAWNMLFVDEKEAGATRDKLVEALKAEGVNASGLHYTLQHELPLYAEDEWWHHKPVIPELPGSTQANATSIALPYFTKDVPEVCDQYVKAFEKVWAHRADL
ncbi:MAG: aminotransferase class I/II-fold pyridoxal phosphate-dependent enzyme [Candidatus Hydrogenedentes bacterium]|nr:aminotransferase class I/II-fold pyridoxal phosphate-dependent enzyme [Candidatus Hydrogenedentota bacterium]